MKAALWLMFALGLSGIACTHAQNAPGAAPVFADGLLRISATVQKWDGAQLQLKSAEGSMTAALPAEVIITQRLAGTLADVKPGLFLGSAAVRGTDGQLHAQEIHLIPETLRGGTGGHRAMNTAPGSMNNTSMTNGSVNTLTDGNAALLQGNDAGMVMTLTYPDGQQKIHVGPDTPVTIVTVVKADVLRSGAQVNVTARANADGSTTLVRIDIMSSGN